MNLVLIIELLDFQGRERRCRFRSGVGSDVLSDRAGFPGC
jgi:hypothetical protein